MKEIVFKKSFQKQFKKLSEAQKNQFYTRLEDFLTERNQPYLNIHSLKGKYQGYKSMNISGDIRALFREEGEKLVIFYLIGTHSELY